MSAMLNCIVGRVSAGSPKSCAATRALTLASAGVEISMSELYDGIAFGEGMEP